MINGVGVNFFTITTIRRVFSRIIVIVAFALAFFIIAITPAHAELPVKLKYTRPELIDKWHTRIQSFLDRGVIPIVDFLSFLPRKNGETVIRRTNKLMDELGVALICLGGYQAEKEKGSRGYHWGYYINEVVNDYPSRYILSTNKGGNKDWWKQKGGKPRNFIDQLEVHVRSGDYPFISQVEFRHYMSNAQCKQGKTERDIDIPINGLNGHRLFQLAGDTGLPFAIHLEPEDHAIDALEEMLADYPNAKVIWTHFGQIRYPEKEKRFGPKLVERLLRSYPNLYFDISTGEPNRHYQCGANVLDTVIWQKSALGQKRELKSEYKAILSRYSNRFVAGLDYGPLNRDSADFFRARVSNIRLILRDVPDDARHNIGYRNAWYLLTGKSWK